MLNEFKLSSNRWQHSFLNYCSTARYFMDAEVSKEIKSSLYENVFQGVIFKSMRHNDLQVSFAHFSFTLVHFQLICSKSTQPYQNCKSFGKTYMAQLMAMITWAKQVQANQPIWGLAKWGTIKKLNFRSYQLACSA